MLGTRGLEGTRRIGWASTENLADQVTTVSRWRQDTCFSGASQRSCRRPTEMGTCSDPEGGPALSEGQSVSKGSSQLSLDEKHKDSIGRTTKKSCYPLVACLDLLPGEDLCPSPPGKRLVWRMRARNVLPASPSLTPRLCLFRNTSSLWT